MNAEKQMLVELSESGITSMATEESQFQVNDCGEVESVSIRLDDHCLHWLNELLSEDEDEDERDEPIPAWLSRAGSDRHEWVDGLVAKYYNEYHEEGRAYAFQHLESADGWKNIGGKGNAIYYHPVKDVGVVLGSNGHLATMTGTQLRDLSQTVRDLYKEAQ